MVQGLAFLSKKSWHTKNLANQEKVWMAEQRKAAEESKTKELAKQIQQEREQEELDKIAGRKTVKRDLGIDWMYKGGSGAEAAAVREAQMQQKNEEYLMGKEFVPQGGATGDFAHLEEGGVNDIVAGTTAATEEEDEKKPAAAVPASTAAAVNAAGEPSVADRNEAFRMRHEDPMFLVSQTQREKQTQQDRKRALYERVVGPTQDKRQPAGVTSDEQRRSKKEKKRERKHRRHRRHRSRSRSRSRSPSRDRGHKRRHKKRHRSRSPSGDDRRRNSPKRRQYEEQRHHGSRRHYRSRSRSYDRDDRSRSPSRPREYRRRESPRTHGGRQRYEREAYINERIPSPGHQDMNRRDHGTSSQPRPEGYGLQGSNSSVGQQRDHLGPNRQLLDQKRQERDSERRRKRETASTRRRMTDEERAAALEAMQNDASKRDELLNQAVASKHRHHREDEHDVAQSRGNASFLQDMAERTHGIGDRHGNGQASLASRVSQNRHTNQKLSDDFF